MPFGSLGRGWSSLVTATCRPPSQRPVFSSTKAFEEPVWFTSATSISKWTARVFQVHIPRCYFKVVRSSCFQKHRIPATHVLISLLLKVTSSNNPVQLFPLIYWASWGSCFNFLFPAHTNPEQNTLHISFSPYGRHLHGYQETIFKFSRLYVRIFRWRRTLISATK